MERTSCKPRLVPPVNSSKTSPLADSGLYAWRDTVREAKTKSCSSEIKRERSKVPIPKLYHPKEEDKDEPSVLRQRVMEHLAGGVTSLQDRLFSYLANGTVNSFYKVNAEETNDLVVYVEKTRFKLGKATATNTILHKCVDALIQTMRFTHDELKQVQQTHREEIAHLRGEQDRLRSANTTLTELLQECRDEIRDIESERDNALDQIKELDNEVVDLEQEKSTLQDGCDQWRQKFTAANAKRLATKVECDKLAQEIDRLNQKLNEEKNRQRFEDMKRKMHDFERQEADAARKRREEQEKRRKEEEKRQREEEKRRQEEEEIQRKAREKAEQERRAREAAMAAEEERCRKRDDTNWGEKPWTSGMALDRFHVVAEEFTTTKYSAERPITSRSIPWPTLEKPSRFTLEGLNWKNVEDFLNYAKKFYGRQDSAKYAKLLKELQLMFHPDRWSSRNILLTVIDKEIQDKLRQAGKIVSQVVNQQVSEDGGR